MVHGEVIAGVKLEAMAVRIADVEEEGIGDAMAAGTALDVLEIAAGGHHVAEVQDVHRGRHPISEVMQARALAVGDRKIMGIGGARFVPQTDSAYDGIRDLVKTLNIDLEHLS